MEATGPVAGVAIGDILFASPGERVPASAPREIPTAQESAGT
jgi:hypothetical protein